MGERSILHTLFTALALVVALSGCATVLDGSNQSVTFNSQPAGARISVNGSQIGVTPLTAQIKRTNSTVVVVHKDGYQDQQLQLQTKTNTTFWLNILFSVYGVFSSSTDYGTGSMIEYSPNMYFVTLEPKERPQIAHGNEVPLPSEKKVRNFILRNHQALLDDIARGDGEYLSALYALLDVPNAEYKITFKKIRAMAYRNKQAPQFAEAILTEFEPTPLR